jgi:hypothetical protein
MRYEKPELIAVAKATEVIEGMKPGFVADNNHLTTPPRSTGAYLSDE